MVHLDESCLGIGRPGDNPGGAAGLVEIRTATGVERRDFFLHASATTNNRMALASALRIWRGDKSGGRFQDYTIEVTDGMVVLDAVHAIQAKHANDLAVRAATEQRSSPGLVPSEFGTWWAARRSGARFSHSDYDPDLAFDALAARLAAGESFPIAGVA